MVVTSGSISTEPVVIPNTDGKTRNVIFSWSKTSTSGSTTTISWTLKGGGTDTGWVYCGPFYIGTSRDGTQIASIPDRISVYNGTTIRSGTFTVSQASSDSFTIHVSAAIYSGTINSRGNDTWTLPSLASVATLSASYPSGQSSIIFGNSSHAAKATPSFSFSNTSSSLYYGLFWSSSDAPSNWTLIAKGNITTISNTSWYLSAAQHGSSFTSPSPKINFRLVTYKDNSYSGSSIVGNSYVNNFNVTYSTSDPDMRPDTSGLTCQINDTAGYYTVLGNICRGKSQGSVTITGDATPYTGTTISTYETQINTGSYNSGRTASFSTNDSNTNPMIVSCRVTDSRGLQSIASFSFTTISYSKPTISTFTAVRQSTVTDIKFTWQNSGGTGNLTRKITSGSTTVYTPISDNSNHIKSGFDANNSYTFVYTVSDAYYSTSATVMVDPAPSEFVLLEIKDDGTGISIGQAAESNKFIVGNMTNGIEFKNNLTFAKNCEIIRSYTHSSSDYTTNLLQTSTSLGPMAWSDQDQANNCVLTKAAVNYWDGRFGSNNQSFLKYCNIEAAAAVGSSGTAGHIIGLKGNLAYNGGAADYVLSQGSSSTSSDDGAGEWQWQEWNSGKVEIWYSGSLKLKTTPSDTNGVKRREQWVAFPNSYTLTKCSINITGMQNGCWCGCGGIHKANDSVAAFNENVRKFSIMAYGITSAPAESQTVHIYIRGTKVTS